MRNRGLVFKIGLGCLVGIACLATPHVSWALVTQSLNSGMQMANQSDVTRRTVLREVNSLPTKTTVVTGNQTSLALWQQRMAYKEVSGNVSGRTFGADARSSESKIRAASFKEVHNNGGQTYNPNLKIELPKPFNVENGYSELANTTQNRLIWETPTDNPLISYQQVLRQVSQNMWTIDQDNIPPTHSQTMVTGTGGRYVVRKVTDSGRFMDSDGENSEGVQGNPDLAKTFVIDLIPPKFTVTPNIRVVSTANRHVQRFRFGIDEGGYFNLEIKDKNQIWYSTIEVISSGSISIDWDQAGNNGIKQDGNFQYRYFVTDKAGNQSEWITGNIRINSLPPIISSLSNLVWQAFSPNNDGKKDSLSYDFSFSEPSSVAWVVKRESGVTVSAGQSNSDATSLSILVDDTQFAGKPDGRHIGVLRATDLQGMTTAATFNFQVDRAVPLVNAASSLVISGVNTEPPFWFTSNESGSVAFELGSAVITRNMVSGGNLLTVQPGNLTDGHYTALFQVGDEAGNTTTKSVAVLIDRGSPRLQVSALPLTMSLKESVPVQFTASDDFSPTMAVSVFVGPWQVIVTSNTTASFDLAEKARQIPGLVDGYYGVAVSAVDSAGNSNVVTRSLTIAQQPVGIICPDIGPLSFSVTPNPVIPYTLVHPGIKSAAHVVISLLDSSRNHIRNLYSGDNVALGKASIPLGAHRIGDGQYFIRFELESETGVTHNFDAKLEIDTTAPTIQRVEILRNPFNYKGDPLRFIPTIIDQSGKLGRLSLFYANQLVASDSLHNGHSELSFDGKIGGNRLSDGRYSFELQATDLAGNQTQQPVEIQIDTQAPHITQFSSDRTLIRSDDAEFGSAQFRVEANEPVSGSVQILNDRRSVIRTLSDTPYVWDGRANDQSIRNGSYSAVATVIDRAGNAVTSSAIVLTIQDAPSISGVELSATKAGPLSPITLSFWTSISGSVTVNIEDARGGIVRRLAARTAVSQGRASFVWDGYGDAGAVLRDGEYVFSIAFVDRNGIATKTAVKKTIELDATSPLISNASLSTDILSYPNHSTTNLNFQISEPVTFNLKLFSSTRTELGNLATQSLLSGGHTISWNGLLNRQSLGQGTYYLEANGTDLAGNQTQKQFEITIVSETPVLITTDQSRLIFSPDGDSINDTLRVGIAVQGTGRTIFDARILSDTGKLIRTLINTSRHSSEMLEWDGRDDKGNMQRTGEFRLVIAAVDQLGRYAQKDIPIALLTDKIQLQVVDNGPYFSFNGDGINDTLRYQIELQIPTVLLNFDSWRHVVTLNAEILQANRVISQTLITITDRGTFSFNGNGVAEGPFELRLSGEGADRVPVLATTLSYLNDQTPPAPATVKVLPSGSGIQAFAIIEPGTSTPLNTTQVSGLLRSAGADFLDLYDQNQNWIRTVTANNGQFLFDFPGSREGSNAYFYQVSDLGGNRSEQIRLEYTVDLTLPVQPRLESAQSLINTATYTDIVLSEIGSTIRAYGDGRLVREWVSTGADSQTWSLNEGVHSIRIESVDPAGNVAIPMVHGIVVDLTPINLTVNGLAGRYLKAGDYPIELGYSETLVSPPTIRLKSGQKYIPVSGNHLLVTPGDDGIYQLEIQNVVDAANNSETIVANGDIILDTTQPTLQFSQPATANLMTRSVTNSILLSEPTLNVTLFVDGTPVETRSAQNQSVAIAFQLDEGRHTISAIAQDPAGNVSGLISQTVIIDLTPPTLTQFEKPTASSVKAGSYSIALGFSEPVRPTMSIQFRSGARLIPIEYNPDTRSIVVPVISGDDGPSDIQISNVHDIAGNEITPVTRHVFDIDTVPPIVTEKAVLHDVPNAVGGRNGQLNIRFSEPVTAQYSVILPDDTELSLNPPENGVISFQIPNNQLGNAILKISSIEDRVGNAIPDDASFVFPIDSQDATLLRTEFVTTTNRGTPSGLRVTTIYSEPIQSNLFQMALKWPDNHRQLPDQLTWSPDRTRATGHFQIGPVESNLRLELSGVRDDLGNVTADQISPLGKVDNFAPLISGYGANSSTFSAIRTVDDANIVVTMNIHEDFSKLYVRIYDRANSLKTTLFDSDGRGGNVAMNAWNGTDSTGHYLPKGWYVMRAWAIDEAGNESLPVEGLFEITEQHLEIVNPQSVPVEYSFIASGPRRFTYSLRDRLDAPNIADRPTGIRTMSVTPVATVTEKIISADTGRDIVTLANNQVTGVFENASLSNWNGRVNGSFVASGRYEFVAEIKNLKDILEDTVRIPFQVDHDAPQVSNVRISPLPVSQLAGSNSIVTVNFSVSDNIAQTGIDTRLEFDEAGLAAERQGISTGESLLSLNVFGTERSVSDGRKTMALIVFDRAKNSTLTQLAVTADSTVPAFDFSIPSRNGFVTHSATIIPGLISDISPVTMLYQRDNAGFGTAPLFDVSTIRDQTSLLSMKVIDLAGNTQIVTRSVQIDNDVPDPAFSITEGGFTTTTLIHLVPTSSETHPLRYWVQSEGNPWISYSILPSLNWALADQEITHTVRLKLEDRAGNISAEVQRTIILDKTSPTISQVTLTGYANFENNTYYYRSEAIDFDNWQITSSPEQHGVRREMQMEALPILEGFYLVMVRVVDSAGNSSDWVGPYRVVIDSGVPVINSLSLTNGNGWQTAGTAQQLNVAYTESYLRHATFTILQGSTVYKTVQKSDPRSVPVSELLQNLPDGQYTCRVRLTDFANRDSAAQDITLYSDQTPPVFSALSSPAYVSGNAFSINFDVSDTSSGVNKVQYRLNTGAWTQVPGSRSISVSGLSEGSYDLWIRAIDNAGNSSLPLKINTVIIDRTNPSLTEVSVSETAINISRRNLILRYSASDVGSGIFQNHYWTSAISRRPLGDSPMNFTESDLPVSDGPLTILLQVADRAGNLSGIQSVNVVFDRLPPTITTDFAALPRYTNREIHFAGTESDRGTGITWAAYKFGSGAWTSFSPARLSSVSIDTSSFSEGDYYGEVIFSDAAGNELVNSFGPITVDHTPPTITMRSGFPISTFQATTQPGAEKTILKRLSIADPNLDGNPSLRIFDETSDVVSGNVNRDSESWVVRWNGWVDLTDSGGSNVSKQAGEGPYFVEVLARDLAGNVASTVSVVTLTDDILVGGTDAHYPSVEDLEGNELKIWFGEGARIQVSENCRASVLIPLGVKERTVTRNIIIDLPQSIVHQHYADGNSTAEESHKFKYFGADGTRSSELVSARLSPPIHNMSYSVTPGYFQAESWVRSDAYGTSVRGQDWTISKFQGRYKYAQIIDGRVNWIYTQGRSVIKPLFNTNSTFVDQGIVKPRIINTGSKFIDQYNQFVVSDRRQGKIGSLWKNQNSGQYKFALLTFTSLGQPIPESPPPGYPQKIQDIIYNGPTGNATNPSFFTQNGITHVAWEDTRLGVAKIYYQQIATPRSSSETSFRPQTVKTQLEATPVTLISPKTTTGDIPVLPTTRPDFTWQVPTASMSSATQFKIELLKDLAPTAPAGLPTFNFNANSLSDHYQEIAVPAGTYKLNGNQVTFTPDIYNSLGKTDLGDVYRWQVNADWTGDQLFDQHSTTSELFKLDPPLEIEAPINYPNPFTDSTQIRYKLSREAQSVSVRIFDMVGRLVRVLSEAPTAGTRPFHEYNQIRWDAKNGPGDTVNNGLYIYKIIATDFNGRQVEAKGKAIKLK